VRSLTFRGCVFTGDLRPRQLEAGTLEPGELTQAEITFLYKELTTVQTVYTYWKISPPPEGGGFQPMSYGGKTVKVQEKKEVNVKVREEKTKEKGETEVNKGKINAEDATIRPKRVPEEYRGKKENISLRG
jgi:hypothetical protein